MAVTVAYGGLNAARQGKRKKQQKKKTKNNYAVT